MKRLTYLFAATLFPLSLAACSTTDAIGNTDGDSEADDEDEDDSETAPPSTTASTTVAPTTTDTPTGTTDEPSTTDEPTTTTDPTSTTGPDTETTDPSGSTTEAPGCTEDDECITADDCPTAGAECLGCLCVGGNQCKDYGEGIYADCINGESCGEGVENATCVVDNTFVTSLSICTFLGCESVCDCPEAPEGFDAQLACDDLLQAPGDECYIDCSGGQDCPDGMLCINDVFCGLGDPNPLDGFGDCYHYGGQCPPTDNSGEPGFCLGVNPPADMSSNIGAICSTVGCDDVDDCPDAPATGNAVVACQDATGDMTNNCILDCSNGETCPDEMTCHADFGVCYFDENVLEDYGECSQVPGACPDNGVCLSDTPTTVSFCGAPCTDVGDCAAEPSGTGNAAPACVTIGATGDRCILDCSGGETCPDGQTCFGGICAHPFD